MSIAREPATLWRPLRVPVFRRVVVADLVSDIGTFMQSVGAAWLMVWLGGAATVGARTRRGEGVAWRRRDDGGADPDGCIVALLRVRPASRRDRRHRRSSPIDSVL